MSSGDNTLFLRLTGVMQSWGTVSRLQHRRTDECPSKSGVLGLLLCARGISREQSRETLEPLNTLLMGVRVDRAQGCADVEQGIECDYHTTGAKYGIRRAEDGKPKPGKGKQEFETQVSYRYYLSDASFLVALQGDSELIAEYSTALQDPVWPVYLGRKCCVPTEPVFVCTGSHESLEDALSSIPFRPLDGKRYSGMSIRKVIIEHPAGQPIPTDAKLVHDVPKAFGYHNQDARWVSTGHIEVSVDNSGYWDRAVRTYRQVDYSSPQWHADRAARLEHDNHLCVFCKSPAEEVHHVEYSGAEHESIKNLRSLCRICHDACTRLEYSGDMGRQRVDPSDPVWRKAILGQIHQMMSERRSGKRREMLEAVRRFDFTEEVGLGGSLREGE